MPGSSNGSVALPVVRGSVSDLVGVRGQENKDLHEQLRLTDAERATLEGALADLERVLATLAELGGVRYSP